MAIEDDIRAFILLTVSAASGRTFCGLLRDPDSIIPHKALGVLQTGGLQPNGYMDGRNTDYRPARVQVVVRSDTGDYASGRDLAEACWSSLQRATASSIGTGYVRCFCVQGAPLYWGRDDKDHHQFSVNLQVEKEE